MKLAMLVESLALAVLLWRQCRDWQCQRWYRGRWHS